MKHYEFVYMEYWEDELHVTNIGHFDGQFAELPVTLLKSVPKSAVPRRYDDIAHIECGMRALNRMFIDGFLHRVKSEVKGSMLEELIDVLKAIKNHTYIVLTQSQYKVFHQAVESLGYGKYFIMIESEFKSEPAREFMEAAKDETINKLQAELERWKKKCKRLEAKVHKLEVELAVVRG